MVKEIKAFQASDGSIHTDRASAAQQDTRLALGKLCKNEALVNEIMNNAQAYFEILQPMFMAPPAKREDN